MNSLKRALKAVLPAQTRRAMRGIGKDLGWLAGEVPRHPRFALFQRAKSRQLRRHMAELAAAAPLDPVRTIPLRDIPRKVWIFWGQGEAQAPDIVQTCIASWREKNPGWDVTVLDVTAANELCDLSDIADRFGLREQSDFLRLRLLEAHGGVWADATVFCHRPLDDWLPIMAASGFFAFSAPGPDRIVSSWFLAAAPGSPIISAWQARLTRHSKHIKTRLATYFQVIYSLEWALRSSPELARVWHDRGGMSARPTLLLERAVKGDLPTKTALHALTLGVPVSKLSHKGAPDVQTLKAILRQAEEADSS